MIFTQNNYPLQRTRSTWNSGTAYAIGDGVLYNGSTYVALAVSTGVAPDSDATKWQLIAQKGTDGTNGAGYLATSTTSLVTAGTGSKSFTTQANLAYTVGARIRATSAGTGQWMEGVVTSYSGTTLVATMDSNSGTGTHTDWNINLAGQPGSGGGLTSPVQDSDIASAAIWNAKQSAQCSIYKSGNTTVGIRAGIILLGKKRLVVSANNVALTLGSNGTWEVYLDRTGSPNLSSGSPVPGIWLATVVVSGGVITTVTDRRPGITWLTDTVAQSSAPRIAYLATFGDNSLGVIGDEENPFSSLAGALALDANLDGIICLTPIDDSGSTIAPNSGTFTIEARGGLVEIDNLNSAATSGLQQIICNDQRLVKLYVNYSGVSPGEAAGNLTIANATLVGSTNLNGQVGMDGNTGADGTPGADGEPPTDGTSGTDGGTGNPGGAGGNLTLINCYLQSTIISVIGGAGGGGGNGGNGGSGGNYTGSDGVTNGGAGGNGGAAGSGGDGGNGGTVQLYYCTVTSDSQIYTNFGNGGGAGNPGSAGTGGSGGSGGSNGTDGSAGAGGVVGNNGTSGNIFHYFTATPSGQGHYTGTFVADEFSGHFTGDLAGNADRATLAAGLLGNVAQSQVTSLTGSSSALARFRTLSSLVPGDVAAKEWQQLSTVRRTTAGLIIPNYQAIAQYKDGTIINQDAAASTFGEVAYAFTAPSGCTSVQLAFSVTTPAGFISRPMTYGIYDASGTPVNATTISSPISDTYLTLTATVQPNARYYASISVGGTLSSTNHDVFGVTFATQLLTAHTTTVTWTANSVFPSSSAKITSQGRLRGNFAGNSKFVGNTIATSADGIIRFTLYVASLNGSATAVMSRMTASGDTQRMFFISQTNANIYVISAGSTAASATSSFNPVVGQRYQVMAVDNGNASTMYIDGVQVATVTSSSVTAAGRLGIWFNSNETDSTGLQIENVQYESLTSGAQGTIVVSGVQVQPLSSNFDVFGASFARYHISPEFLHNNLLSTLSNLAMPVHYLCSTMAKIVFQTTAPRVVLEYICTNNQWASGDDFTVYVNGRPLTSAAIVTSTAQPLGSQYVNIELTQDYGLKIVEIIMGGANDSPIPSGATVNTNTPEGTFPIALYVPNIYQFNLIPASSSTVGRRLLIYSDSIGSGFGATVKTQKGWPALLRREFASVTNESYAYRAVYDDWSASAQQKILSRRVAMTNPTDFILAQGSNDYGLNKQSAANYQTMVGSMMDTLHTQFPAMKIWCLSPWLRSSEGANTFGDTLGAYRTAMSAAQSTRTSFSDYIDTSGFYSTSDLNADAIHPNDVGHGKIFKNLLPTLRAGF